MISTIYIGLAAVALGAAVALAWNRMPDSWLCDYGEEVTERHKHRRISVWKRGGIYALCFGAAGYWIAWRNFGGDLTLETAGNLIATGAALWLLVLIAMADQRFMIIPDQLVLGLILLSLAESTAVPAEHWADWMSLFLRELGIRAGAGLMCGGSFWTLGIAARLPGRLFRRRSADIDLQKDAGKDAGEESEGFGFGDVKLLFALGALLGAEGGFFTLFTASLLCGAQCGVMVILRRVGMEEERPFGPYVCAAAVFYLLMGNISGQLE